MTFCIRCSGRGGFRDGFGHWRRCTCVTPSKPAIRAQASSRQLEIELESLRRTDPEAYTRELQRRLDA